jgi:uncharacterized membrane protein
MNVKKVSLIITFAAVAIALNTFRIPTIFYPSNYFQFSQIPIVIAFLLFGTRIGISIGAVNLLVSIMILPFSSTSIVTYTMDFLSLLPMFAGLKLAEKFTSQNKKMEEFSTKKKPIVCMIAFPTAFRAMTMPILDYGFVFHFVLPLFFGINFSGAAIAALVPSFVLYNVIVPFYTVPVAYVVTTKISGRARFLQSQFDN